MRFFLQSIRIIVHIILSPYEPKFDQYLRRYKNILEIPLIPLTPTRKKLYPSPGVRVFMGRGRGTPPDTWGLPLTITKYRRLTCPSSGTCAKLMRHLYIAVALPRITYGLDVWYTPPGKKAGQTRNSGSAAALHQLQKVQRIAMLEITGALCTTPNDYVDAHSGVLPMELALLKATHRAAVRLLTLPPTHPLQHSGPYKE